MIGEKGAERMEAGREGVKAPPPIPRIDPEQPGGLAEGGSAVGGLLLGLGLAVLVLVNNDSSDPFGETMERVATAALACLPGLLCLLAGRRRPPLYLAGGMIGVAIPMLLGSIVGVGFWIPAGLAFVAYGRRSGSVRGRVADPVVALVCFVLALTALAAMFVHQDPACSIRANASECTSDYVTSFEGFVSVAITALTLIMGWTLSRPSDHAL